MIQKETEERNDLGDKEAELSRSRGAEYGKKELEYSRTEARNSLSQTGDATLGKYKRIAEKSQTWNKATKKERERKK